MDAPERLSCSISERGAERTNASEMQGARPVTTYCSVRPPRHVPPSALTLNTVSPPNRYHSKIGSACYSVMLISCHRHRKVTDRHRKVTCSSPKPETSCVAPGATRDDSNFQELGNPDSARKSTKLRPRETSWRRTDATARGSVTFFRLLTCSAAYWNPRRNSAGVFYADRETGFCWPGTAARSSRV
jgi:hypothetical protein